MRGVSQKRSKYLLGFGALAAVLFCGMLFHALFRSKQSGDITLRVLPREILCVLGAIGLVVLLLWGNIRLRRFLREKMHKPFSWFLCNLVHIVSAAGVLVFGAYFVTFMAFAHTPEHIVEKNGIKMVASVNSFLDMDVYYYQYINPLFYGELLGHEWYGSGGNDPLEADPPLEPRTWDFYDLDGNTVDSGERGYASMYGAEIAARLSDPLLQELAPAVSFDTRVQKEPQTGMLTFSSALTAYADSFNGSFYREKKMRYFPPLETWQQYRYGISHGVPLLTRWYFSENTADAKCPIVSVYTAGTAQNVWKVELVFDTHATNEIQNLQRDLFQHSMCVFCADTVYKTRHTVYQTVTQAAKENVCALPSDTVPGGAVRTLCYQDGVGIYAYVINNAELHICFVPVTEELLREYESKGVTLYDIAQDFK